VSSVAGLDNFKNPRKGIETLFLGLTALRTVLIPRYAVSYPSPKIRKNFGINTTKLLL
jgi:hypothetical protein